MADVEGGGKTEPSPPRSLSPRSLPGHRRRRAAPSSIEEGTLPFASWVEVQTKGYLGATMAAPGRSQRKGTRIATLLALAAVLATANATVTSHEDQGRAALKALQHRAVLEQDNGEASEASLFQRFLRWKEPQGCWTAALENAQFEHSCDKIDSEQTRRLAFSFLVCHLEEAGKPAPACRLEQQVKTCIQRLDTDAFGAWTQVSGRLWDDLPRGTRADPSPSVSSQCPFHLLHGPPRQCGDEVLQPSFELDQGFERADGRPAICAGGGR